MMKIRRDIALAILALIAFVLACLILHGGTAQGAVRREFVFSSVGSTLAVGTVNNADGTQTVTFTSTASTVTNAPFAINGVSQSGITFDQATTGATFAVAQRTSDAITTTTSLQGQAAFGSATTNKTGGLIQLIGGDNQGGGHAGEILIQGAAPSPSVWSAIQVRSNGIGGVPNDPSTLHVPWVWQPITIALTSGITTTMTTTQSAAVLLMLTGTLTGSGTVFEFPNVAGFWIVDISGLSGFSSTNTLSFKSGTSTVTVINTALTPGQGNEGIIVWTTGSNAVRTLGSTVSPL